MKIDGATVIVTGASGGLGLEFVRQSLDRGAVKVYAAARRPVTGFGLRVVPLQLDVTDSASVADTVAAATDVDIVINNAGILGAPSLLTSPMAEIRRTYETNVLGPLEVVRGFAPVLAERGGGAVVDIHSALSWIATAGAYSSSKAALWGLTNSLRLELAGQSTQVLGAHLAYADTPMTARLDGVPKSNPATVVARILDALEENRDEVIVDEVTEMVRSSLSTNTIAALPG